MAVPAGLNAAPEALNAPGKVAGLANLAPNPAPDHGYAEIKGVLLCATAIALPDGLKATP